jgi:hypothetical protein
MFKKSPMFELTKFPVLKEIIPNNLSNIILIELRNYKNNPLEFSLKTFITDFLPKIIIIVIKS